jgi:RNA polymerase sigma-70 factor (ECF subfamily)
LNKPAVIPSNPMQKEGMQAAETEDIELVAKCQRGDTQAFNELVTKYRGKVYAMIYNMVHNEQDAWDLAQDGFLKAWKSIGRFRGQSAFYTWLYRIVMNVTIDWVRKKKITGDAEFDEELGLQGVEAAASTAPRVDPLPFQKMEGEEIRRRIDDAVEKLSPEHRAVILMREMDGMQYEEIAEALDCSVGTVMSRLFYARKKLQILLRDVYENV